MSDNTHYSDTFPQSDLFAGIVEFENQDTFKAMHGSPAHDTAGEHAKPLFDGNPTPHFYQVVIG
jgi:hypothetical protein